MAAAKLPRNNAISLSLGPEISEQRFPSKNYGSDFKMEQILTNITLSVHPLLMILKIVHLSLS